MKKFMPYIVVFVFIGVIVTLFLSLGKAQKMVVIKEGNYGKKPLEMEVNRYQDSFCGMVITELGYASQVVAPDGKTWFFHDHGDFVEWLKDKSFANKAVIWVMSRDTHHWIDAKKAFYSINENTPMGYGFGAYEKEGKDMINFEEMRLRVLRGETMNNPLIRKKLLEQHNGDH
jgi:nitrous oxide reductase accessory protein NosL